ncbi:-dihydroxy-2-butanone 4-phosphate synthase [Phaffia rhodozyma]|uniref:3,4-dihydroxy-2-butanone 4-phosphate synthase n=1 Tax=Phaffia rhodozyma TaxID=264483 RepID=A0A0F7SWT6_PHARH|nr:-dihydroxy-2-butanone 4-phosphate synthase [Phaffia rhodozyma]
MSSSISPFSTMEDAIAAFGRGEFVVVMDDEDRENEGDLLIAASECTTEKMAWFIKHTSGYICISLPQSRLEALDIPMMVARNEETNQTAYTVTVDYNKGTTTGISAHDRALTARKLADLSSSASDFNRPGHMVPLRYHDGGVLKRKGHTESALDLCVLASLPPAGLLCELVAPDPNPTGRMAQLDDCITFAKQWNLPLITVEMLKRWREQKGL